MPLDEIGKLPPLAVIAFGITLAFGLLVMRFGLFQGFKSAPVSSGSTAQVAAVIVDPSALNRATAALEAFNMTMIETNKIGRDLVESNELIAKASDRIREELRINREVGRS